MCIFPERSYAQALKFFYYLCIRKLVDDSSICMYSEGVVEYLECMKVLKMFDRIWIWCANILLLDISRYGKFIFSLADMCGRYSCLMLWWMLEHPILFGNLFFPICSIGIYFSFALVRLSKKLIRCCMSMIFVMPL